MHLVIVPRPIQLLDAKDEPWRDLVEEEQLDADGKPTGRVRRVLGEPVEPFDMLRWYTQFVASDAAAGTKEAPSKFPKGERGAAMTHRINKAGRKARREWAVAPAFAEGAEEPVIAMKVDSGDREAVLAVCAEPAATWQPVISGQLYDFIAAWREAKSIL